MGLLKSVTAEAVESGSLDIFVGCEVGGHKQGLPAAGIDYKDVVAGAPIWQLMEPFCDTEFVLFSILYRIVIIILCYRFPTIFSEI